MCEIVANVGHCRMPVIEHISRQTKELFRNKEHFGFSQLIKWYKLLSFELRDVALIIYIYIEINRKMLITLLRMSVHRESKIVNLLRNNFAKPPFSEFRIT